MSRGNTSTQSPVGRYGWEEMRVHINEQQPWSDVRASMKPDDHCDPALEQLPPSESQGVDGTRAVIFRSYYHRVSWQATRTEARSDNRRTLQGPALYDCLQAYLRVHSVEEIGSRMLVMVASAGSDDTAVVELTYLPEDRRCLINLVPTRRSWPAGTIFPLVPV